MKDMLSMAAILLLMACGNSEAPGESPQGAALETATPSPVSATSDAPQFSATISGAIDRTVEGDYAVAGARYRRYHINMTSGGADGEPAVVIAFGRDDTSSPGPGTYVLTDLGGGGFSGSIEIRDDPQREFTVTSGELVIDSARGDAVSGRFELTAKEIPADYGGPSDEISVSGVFRAKVAD